MARSGGEPRRLAALVVALVAGCAVGPAAASAAPGDPAPFFGASLGAGTELNALAVRPDGGIVAVGKAGPYQLVARFSAGGALQGTSTPGPGVLRGVAVQADGKAVVVGDGAGGIVAERLNAEGGLDSSFATGGVVRGPVGGRANAVALGPSGTIVVAGSVRAADSFSRIALLRLRADGSADGSIGRQGMAVVDLGEDSTAKGVTVQGDGKIVVAGSQGPGTFQAVNALVARVGVNGALDKSFGSRGVFFYFHPRTGGASTFNAVALDPAGGIVVGGGDSEDAGPQALFARLTCAGAGDASFGPGGLARAPAHLNFIGAPYGVNAITVAAGGRIVGAGRFQESGLASAAVWGFAPNGANVFTTIAPASAEARGLTVDGAGNFLVAGTRIPAGQPTSGFVARYAGFGARASGSTPCGGLPPAPPAPPTPLVPRVAPGVTPTVATGAASAVTATRAQVSGSVTPNGASTTYAFEYGRTTAYGRATALVSAGSGAAAVPVSTTLSGLGTGTRYHYRLVAVNGRGGGVGADATFVTPPRRLTLRPLGLGRRPLRLASVLRSGLRLRLGCNRPCAIVAELRLGRKDARRLHLGKGSTSVGRARATLRRRGTVTLRIHLARKARRRFARQRRVALELRVVARPRTGGRRAVFLRRVTLVR